MTCRSSLARVTASALALALLCEPFEAANAQSAPIVYPGAGQSMDQQARDETECRNWATQQTDVYPTRRRPHTTEIRMPACPLPVVPRVERPWARSGVR